MNVTDLQVERCIHQTCGRRALCILLCHTFFFHM